MVKEPIVKKKLLVIISIEFYTFNHTMYLQIEMKN